jgi:hypothetical protein
MRRTSLKVFATYLTLSCVSLAATKYVTAWADGPGSGFAAICSWQLCLVSSALIGATVGSLFGRAMIGAAIMTALFIALSCWILLLVLNSHRNW